MICEQHIKIQYWQEVIELIFPDALIESHRLNELDEELGHANIVVCLIHDKVPELVQLLQHLKEKDIPVICIGEQVSLERYQQYVSLGVRGFLNGKYISVEKFQNALQIVHGGGFYIEPLSEKPLATTVQEPNIPQLKLLK